MFVSKRLHRISFSQFVFVVFPHLGGGGIIGAGQFRDPQFFLLHIFKYCPALQNNKNLEGKSGRLFSDWECWCSSISWDGAVRMGTINSKGRTCLRKWRRKSNKLHGDQPVKRRRARKYLNWVSNTSSCLNWNYCQWKRKDRSTKHWLVNERRRYPEQEKSFKFCLADFFPEGGGG